MIDILAFMLGCFLLYGGAGGIEHETTSLAIGILVMAIGGSLMAVSISRMNRK